MGRLVGWWVRTSLPEECVGCYAVVLSIGKGGSLKRVALMTRTLQGLCRLVLNPMLFVCAGELVAV